MSINPYILILRPHQYVKNTFIILPLFFAQKFNELDLVLNNTIAFISFCAVSSAVYIINDYFDCEVDRNHPIKKNRPLAAGTITNSHALLLCMLCLVFGLGIAFWLGKIFFYILLGYLFLNIIYSFGLKHISLIDVYIIAIGFLLRIFSGSAVSHVHSSMWIILITFLLALFLAFAKRRDDVLLFDEHNVKLRESIKGYNLTFINVAMAIMVPIIIVSYIFYTISPEVMERFHSEYLYLTALFVLFGILRYMQITLVENWSGSPTQILIKDKFLQVTILGWLCTFIFLIY